MSNQSANDSSSAKNQAEKIYEEIDSKAMTAYSKRTMIVEALQKQIDRAEKAENPCNMWEQDVYCPCQDCAKGIREEISRLQAENEEWKARCNAYEDLEFLAKEHADNLAEALEYYKDKLSNGKVGTTISGHIAKNALQAHAEFKSKEKE